MSKILILGAGSDVARELCEIYASKGFDLILAGRNTEELKRDAKNLSNRYSINADARFFDAVAIDKNEKNSHDKFYKKVKGSLYGVVAAFGYLGDADTARKKAAESSRILLTNFNGAVSILDLVANDLEEKGEGFIIGISSVAGDRGRQSNYHYGSAKAGFTAYLSGLRNRLFKSGVHVLTVKPGFIQSKMTKGLNLPPVITALPARVARDIYRAQLKKKNCIYTKWHWYWLMMIVRNIPEFIFKRLST